MRRLSRFLPALGWMALIFFLSSQSSFPVPRGIWSFDKVIHAGAYFVGCAAWLFALRVRDWRSGLIAVAITSAYGATDELHQYFVPGRSCDVYDWVADTAGAFFTLLAAWGSWRLKGSRSIPGDTT